MAWPTLRTHDRLSAGGSLVIGEFERSYLGIRFLIGFLGLALPIALVCLDAFLLDLPIKARDSMSAYYHSSARDLFVGGLWAIAVILISYLWWRWTTWDFWFSLLAGIATLGVATFPTERAGVASSATSCAEQQAVGTPPCARLQEILGEDTSYLLHQISAGVVVAAFALLCLVFALRDFGYGVAAHEAVARGNEFGVRAAWQRERHHLLRFLVTGAPRAGLFLLLMLVILLGAAWTFVGPNLPWPRVYTGEFMAFTSFGTAWLVAAYDLYAKLLAKILP